MNFSFPGDRAGLHRGRRLVPQHLLDRRLDQVRIGEQPLLLIWEALARWYGLAGLPPASAALPQIPEILTDKDESAATYELLTMNAVYYGISYRSYMRRSPFGAMELAAKGDEERQQTEFLDYLVAGLSGP